MHPTEVDLQPFTDGKADQFGFDPEHLMDDDLFLDPYYLDAEQIQDFLANTPYSRRSFLADYSEGGITTAEFIANAAEEYQINPLVLLVKLQVETSLIYAESEPTRFRMDHAMGCGCPDGDAICRYAPKGLFAQITCAARLFRQYMNQLDADGHTLTGWGPGIEKLTSERQSITPRTKATAALYTYTPWVLRGEGGNWLYWNISRRFSAQLTRNLMNHRWIGGPCQSDAECPYDGGICSTTFLDHGATPGFCTLECESVCPDSMQPNTRTTRCVAGAELGAPSMTGLCTSQCSQSQSHGDEGCGLDLVCREAARADDSSTTRLACALGDESAETGSEDDPQQPHDG